MTHPYILPIIILSFMGAGIGGFYCYGKYKDYREQAMERDNFDKTISFPLLMLIIGTMVTVGPYGFIVAFFMTMGTDVTTITIWTLSICVGMVNLLNPLIKIMVSKKVDFKAVFTDQEACNRYLVRLTLVEIMSVICVPISVIILRG